MVEAVPNLVFVCRDGELGTAIFNRVPSSGTRLVKAVPNPLSQRIETKLGTASFRRVPNFIRDLQCYGCSAAAGVGGLTIMT